MRRRSTALAEERASSSRTCDREYSLWTNQGEGYGEKFYPSYHQ